MLAFESESLYMVTRVRVRVTKKVTRVGLESVLCYMLKGVGCEFVFILSELNNTVNTQFV